MIFVQDTKEWGVLIPGILLSGIGSVYIFVKLGHLGFYMITRIVEVYWPLLLIAIGLSLLLRRSIIPALLLMCCPNYSGEADRRFF